MKTEDDGKQKPYRKFYKCVVQDWSDEFTIKFAEASFQGRQELLKELLAEHECEHAEAYVKLPGTPDGVCPPYRTYAAPNEGKKRKKTKDEQES